MFTDSQYFIHRPAFEDELTRDLKHTGAGILSMANRYRKFNDNGVLQTMLHCCKAHSVMKSKMVGEDEEYLFNSKI